MHNDCTETTPPLCSWSDCNSGLKLSCSRGIDRYCDEKKASHQHNQDAMEGAKASGVKVRDFVYDSAHPIDFTNIAPPGRPCATSVFDARKAFLRFHYLRCTIKVFNFYDLPYPELLRNDVLRLLEIGWITPDDLDFAFARGMVASALLERFKKTYSRKAWNQQRPWVVLSEKIPSFAEFQEYVVREEICRLATTHHRTARQCTKALYGVWVPIAKNPRQLYNDAYEARHFEECGRFGLKRNGIDDAFIVEYLQDRTPFTRTRTARRTAKADSSSEAISPHKSGDKGKKRRHDDDETPAPSTAKKAKVSDTSFLGSISEWCHSKGILPQSRPGESLEKQPLPNNVTQGPTSSATDEDQRHSEQRRGSSSRKETDDIDDDFNCSTVCTPDVIRAALGENSSAEERRIWSKVTLRDYTTKARSQWSEFAGDATDKWNGFRYHPYLWPKFKKVKSAK